MALGYPVTWLSLGYKIGPAFVVHRPRSPWTCWTSTRDTPREDFECDCDIHTRLDATKCGAGGGVEAGWSGDKRLLFPAEWGTSVELGSVKRGPPSGCTDPGL